MKLSNVKKWLLGGSVTGALIFALVGSFMYSSISEFFNPVKKVVTEADKKTHGELSKIEELLVGQGKTSDEINNSLRQLLGENFQLAENDITLNYLEERLQNETIEEIILRKDKFVEETAKINTEDLRELKISELNELSEKNPETILLRLSRESKELIETILGEYSSKIISNLITAGYSKEVVINVIDVADLREIKTSDLNNLAEKSPEAMLSRLKGENKIVIETLAKEYSNKIIPYLIMAGYSKEVIANVIDVADLREIKTSDLNNLAEKSPEAMLERLKGEDKMVIESISKEHSSNVFQYLIDGGYSEQIIKSVIEFADLRELKISNLNGFSEKSPEAMLARMKDEDKMVVESISKEHSNNIIQNLISAGYSEQIINEVIEAADLRELRISDLNNLSEKSPKAMLIRLKTESEAVIKYLGDRTEVLKNTNWQI